MDFLNTNISLLIAVFLACLLIGLLVCFYVKKKSNHQAFSLSSSSLGERSLEHAYKLLPEAVVILNTDNQVIYLNVVAEDMLSCKLRSVMGSPCNEIFKLLNPNTRREILSPFESSNNIERNCLLDNYANQTFSIILNLIHSEVRGEARKVLMLRDITERKALESQLSYIETYDPLTKMLNRKVFDGEVKQLIENAHKHNLSHVLAYFSIDQFHLINDSIGYASGEKLIINISEEIKKNVDKSVDIVGRVSANEFAVVFVDSKLSSAILRIQKILKSAEESKFVSLGQTYAITLSSGFVVVDEKTTSSARAIAEANTACNLASKRGGNGVLAYHSDNSDIQKLEGNLEWMMILKKALQEDRFRMHAQAIHPLKLGEFSKPFHHYELLIRLNDEKGKPISPAEFISAAEYYSMMPRLDRWVVKHVLKKLSKIPQQQPMPVFAINLSGQSLNEPQFLEFVQKKLKSSGVNPRMLCFEITEQVAVEDLSSINNFIATLKGLGCKFSLDDFGTGVSSYSYLRSLDVDYLKIDGSFVKNIIDDDVAKTMVQSINQVGHTMNLDIIAEYVENEEIIKILRQMGVDYGQGYGIAKPCPIEEVIRRHCDLESAEL